MRQLLCALIVLSSVATVRAATPLFYEPFSYTGVGDELTTAGSANSWFKISGTTEAPKIASGNLSYPGLSWTPSGNSLLYNNSASAINGIASREITPGRISPTDPAGLPGYHVSEGKTLYYSVLLRVNSITGLAASVDGSFIGGFRSVAGDSAVQVAQVGSPLLIRQARDGSGNVIADHYQIGTGLTATANTSGITPARPERFWGTPQAVDSENPATLLLVFAHQLESHTTGDGNAARLWINPDPTKSEAENLSARQLEIRRNHYGDDQPFLTTISGGRISNIFFRNNSVAANSITVDELRVADSWAGVMSIPEPASLSLLALAGLGLIRRRRSV